ncbi:hypothetical protein BH10PLA1_BH10PLA1_03940 [soil metagenome]
MPISLIQSLREVPIAVFDTETTGAAAELGDRVVEIGIVKLLDGQVIERYSQLLDPQRRISPGASAITGITQAMVTGQPTFADVGERVCELLTGSIVVGHNVHFDLSFIHREFARLRIDLCELCGPTHVLDTVRIARRRFGRGGNGLSRLAARLAVPQTLAHRALADAETTAGVLDRLLEPVGGWSIMVCDAMVQQGGPIAFKPAERARSLPLELDEALELQLPVMMEYLDARDNRTRRKIAPIHIKKLGGELLLVAHCHLRDAQRTFKVERIVSVTRIEEINVATAVDPSMRSSAAPIDQPTLF